MKNIKFLFVLVALLLAILIIGISNAINLKDEEKDSKELEQINYIFFVVPRDDFSKHCAERMVECLIEQEQNAELLVEDESKELLGSNVIEVDVFVETTAPMVGEVNFKNMGKEIGEIHFSSGFDGTKTWNSGPGSDEFKKNLELILTELNLINKQD